MSKIIYNTALNLDTVPDGKLSQNCDAQGEADNIHEGRTATQSRNRDDSERGEGQTMQATVREATKGEYTSGSSSSSSYGTRYTRRWGQEPGESETGVGGRR